MEAARTPPSPWCVVWNRRLCSAGSARPSAPVRRRMPPQSWLSRLIDQLFALVSLGSLHMPWNAPWRASWSTRGNLPAGADHGAAHPTRASVCSLTMLDRVRSHLKPPLQSDQRSLHHPEREWFSQFHQDETLWPLLQRLQPHGGFFVESGAFDGETHSNTLTLERRAGWQGLLIEPDPLNHPALLARRRNAHILLGGIATNLSDGIDSFALDRDRRIGNFGENGALAQLSKWRRTDGKMRPGQFAARVYVAPLGAVLRAVGREVVDLWSLDVEGAEELVLEANLGSQTVGVLLIETVSPRAHCLLNAQGLILLGRLAGGDQVYANESYLHTRNVSASMAKRLLRRRAGQSMPV